jgi:MinD superfamily P-loop ATPase
MIISVASGKGGTGKTTISTNLALSIADNVQLLDCDVEEPNAHIFIKPKIVEKKAVVVPVPQINEERCVNCGKCAEVCAYNAIAVLSKKVLVFSELCHSCGSCQYFCPFGAISEVSKQIGFIEVGKKNNLDFIHGKLKIGEVVAIPVIKEVKKHIDDSKTVIIDAPPGTSCPVIESVKDSDFCILVTEPTPFGLNDLILAVEVLRKMKIPFGVVINRCDLGDKNTENYCAKENIIILMRIPFKKEIALAYSQGIPIINKFPEYKVEFKNLLRKVQKQFNL